MLVSNTIEQQMLVKFDLPRFPGGETVKPSPPRSARKDPVSFRAEIWSPMGFLRIPCKVQLFVDS